MIFKLDQAAGSIFNKDYIKNLPNEIEINTLEELITFIKKYKNDIVIHLIDEDDYWKLPTMITIYNGYME